MTTLPALSTPCTWNTFLARSTPMVLTCIWTTPSGDSLFNDPLLAHSMPGAGVVHHIIRDRGLPRWNVRITQQRTSPIGENEWPRWFWWAIGGLTRLRS